MSDLLRLALRLKRADVELCRAIARGEQPRLSKAGTSYAVAKIRLFKAAEAERVALAQRPPLPPEQEHETGERKARPAERERGT